MAHSASTYGRTAKAFHWTIALLIALMFVLGWTMDEEERHLVHTSAVDFHMNIGIAIIALVVLRLIWRLRNPPPPLPAHMSRLEGITAELGHAALYFLTFAIPVVGLAMVIVEGEAVLLFGLIDLDNETKRPEVAELLAGWHKWLGWGLLAVLAGHVLAALRHHFLLRDDVLRRMMPSASS
jgi:cytochrome b561